jgi:hypothetical protein
VRSYGAESEVRQGSIKDITTEEVRIEEVPMYSVEEDLEGVGW